MLIQFDQAHNYRGPMNVTKKDSRHAPVARKTYYPGDIVDVPARYFEQRLEHEKFAHVYNASAAAEGAASALMDDMPIEQVRALCEKHELEVVGTGEAGRATKDDMAKALETHYRDVGAELADDQEIPDDRTLGRMRFTELEEMAEQAGVGDVEGSGRDDKVLKADLIEALIEARDAEDEEEDEED